MYTIVQEGYESLVYDSNDNLLRGKDVDEFYFGMCKLKMEDIKHYCRVIIDGKHIPVEDTYIARQNTVDGYWRERHKKDKDKWQVANAID